jgi:hypothetical protein
MSEIPAYNHDDRLMQSPYIVQYRKQGKRSFPTPKNTRTRTRGKELDPMKCSGCELTDKDFPSKGLFLAHCKTHDRPAPDPGFYIPAELLPGEINLINAKVLQFFYLTGYYRGPDKGLEIEEIKFRHHF